MKRASVCVDQSHAIDDEAKVKLKYQTLLNEYLDLQKECVSKKRKLKAAKQKRETTLAEVRFLRRKRKYLLKNQAPKIEKSPLHLPNSATVNMLQAGRNQSTSQASPNSFGFDLVTNSCLKNKAEKGIVREKGVKFRKKRKNNLVEDKGAGKHIVVALSL